MPDYTVEKIHNDINNSLDGSLLFKDPFGGCSFTGNEVFRAGQVVWSDRHQAFAGPGYNIPMSWKV